MSFKVKWLGHAAFLITSSEGNILIDPFITENPRCTLKIDELPKIDIIVVTHAHYDHIGDTVEIAKKHNSLVVSTVEIVNYCHRQGVERNHGQQVGSFTDHKLAKIKFTIAHHGSSFPNGDYGGVACGVVLNIQNKKIYHTGDTELFLDMKLIGNLGIDLALVPIGGNYTMGPLEAAMAVEFIKPDIVVPMHYGTWDIINVSVDEFVSSIKKSKTQVKLLQPGESIEFLDTLRNL
jgi:L-ascorbate metabolism protein UlaG (beta-lactamase superfamily)